VFTDDFREQVSRYCVQVLVNAVTGEVNSDQNHLSGNATNQELSSCSVPVRFVNSEYADDSLNDIGSLPLRRFRQ
jgi:hypothetical protein